MKNSSIRVIDDLSGLVRRDINPYLLKLEEAREKKMPIVFGPSLKDKKGKWLDYIRKDKKSPQPSKLIVEIGVHMGQVFCQLAKDHPNWGFVGLDITFKRVYSTCEKLVKNKIVNAVSVLADASYLEEIFSINEIDGVIIFFPDPWDKKRRQTKNRLINNDFCKTMSRLIKPGGFFWMKTDSQNYFLEVSNLIGSISDFKKSNHSDIGKDYPSIFQTRFQEKNIGFYNCIWVK